MPNAVIAAISDWCQPGTKIWRKLDAACRRLGVIGIAIKAEDRVRAYLGYSFGHILVEIEEAVGHADVTRGWLDGFGVVLGHALRRLAISSSIRGRKRWVFIARLNVGDHTFREYLTKTRVGGAVPVALSPFAVNEMKILRVLGKKLLGNVFIPSMARLQLQATRTVPYLPERFPTPLRSPDPAVHKPRFLCDVQPSDAKCFCAWVYFANWMIYKISTAQRFQEPRCCLYRTCFVLASN
jgi:hypothetical protein